MTAEDAHLLTEVTIKGVGQCGSTNTEPGAVATEPSVDYEPRCSSRNSCIERFAYRRLQPVAAAPRSVFVDPRCQPFCYVALAVVFSAEAGCSDAQIRNRERSGDRVHVALLPNASRDEECRTQHVLQRCAHTN